MHYRMAGNIGGEFNLAIWQSSVGSTNVKSPKLLYTKVYSYSCANAVSGCCEKLQKCLDSPGRTIPSCVLPNLCTMTGSIAVVLSSFSFPLILSFYFIMLHCIMDAVACIICMSYLMPKCIIAFLTA